MPGFQHIEYLLLLTAIPVMVAFYLLAIANKKATMKKLGDASLVRALTPNYSSRAFLNKFILIALAFGCLTLAFANLRKPGETQAVSRNGIDVMIALDVSKSMLARDINPNRLERAKQLLGRLMDRLPDDRIGLVLFAGKAYLQMPLTEDHAAAKMYLSAAGTETVPTQGTVIGDALKMCFAAFNSKEKKYKAVVLISDGEDHDEGAEKIASQMATEGVVIHTIGMGSPQGAPIMDEATNEYKKDNAGNVVITKLNEAELGAIAKKGEGQYILFNNTENVVADISSRIGNMDKRTVTEDSLINYNSYFQYFLIAALLLLIVELFMAETKKITPNNLSRKAAMFVLFLLAFNPSFAQEQKKLIKQGNDAYKKNDFPKAHEAYTKAVQAAPDDSTAQFNLGNTLFKTEKYAEAENAYDNALKKLSEPVQKSNTWYNKGVALQTDKKLPECVDAYKNALKLDPENEDARKNLQIALKQMQQKQQQDKQQDKQKDKNKQQKKPEDKKSDPKPQPSKLSKQDAEDKLKALLQQEKNLQDKLHKTNVSSLNKPEKDW